MMRQLRLLLFVLMVPAAGGMLAGDAVVIANSEVKEQSINAATLKSIYLGKRKKWDDGSKVVLTSLKDGDTADRFLKGALRKTVKQFLTYWKKMVFTGKGAMPRLFATEAELVDYVRSTPGAIGFVSADTPHDGVNVLTVRD